METESIEIIRVPLWFDLTAVFAGALFGAVQSRKSKFDVSGMLVLAIVCGLGGGIARDLLLNKTPVAFVKWEYITVALFAGAVGIWLAERILRVRWLYDLIDGLALGVYTLVGVTLALDARVAWIGAIVIGGIAATAGGIARDILVNEVPATLRPGTPYLTASLIGSAAYALMDSFEVDNGVAALAAILLIVAIRLAALGFGWTTPEPELVSSAVDQGVGVGVGVARQIPGAVVHTPAVAVAPARSVFHWIRRRSPAATSPAAPEPATDPEQAVNKLEEP